MVSVTEQPQVVTLEEETVDLAIKPEEKEEVTDQVDLTIKEEIKEEIVEEVEEVLKGQYLSVGYQL